MSSLVHDLSLSSAIVSGVLLALALAFDVIQRVIVGTADQITMDAVTILLTTFVTAVTAERVSKQVREGKPVLPTNGLNAHNDGSGGTSHGES